MCNISKSKLSILAANPMAGQTSPSNFTRKSKSRKGMSCSFHNVVFVKEIPSVRTYSESEKQLCWYNDEDYRCFKLAMFLERFSTVLEEHNVTPIKPKNRKKKQGSNDTSPTQPRRRLSPPTDRSDLDRTLRCLPTNLPFLDDSSDEEDSSSIQKAMQDKIPAPPGWENDDFYSPRPVPKGNLKDKLKLKRKPRNRFDPKDPLQSPRTSRKSLPDESSSEEPVPVKKQHELDHPPTKPSRFSPQTLASAPVPPSAENTIDILDSALSIFHDAWAEFHCIAGEGFGYQVQSTSIRGPNAIDNSNVWTNEQDQLPCYSRQHRILIRRTLRFILLQQSHYKMIDMVIKTIILHYNNTTEELNQYYILRLL